MYHNTKVTFQIHGCICTFRFICKARRAGSAQCRSAPAPNWSITRASLQEGARASLQGAALYRAARILSVSLAPLPSPRGGSATLNRIFSIMQNSIQKGLTFDLCCGIMFLLRRIVKSRDVANWLSPYPKGFSVDPTFVGSFLFVKK